MSTEQAEGFEGFVAIVERGSIAAAARHLGVPRETLSRRLSRLEDRLGVRLLHRTTRHLRPTPEGKALYPHAQRVVAAAAEAVRAVRRVDDVPRGTLRVSLPPGAAESFLGALFADFLHTWPEVELEVLSTSRYVDLRAEGIDVALRGGSPQDDSLVSRRLWRSGLIAVASVEYARRRGLPRSLEELAQHDCVVGLAEGQRSRRWPTRGGQTVAVGGRAAANDQAVQMALVRRGAGIGMTLRPFVEEELESGDLVAVLPELLGTTASMSVVFADRDRMQPKVRAFIDHVVEWFGANDLDAVIREQRRSPGSGSAGGETRLGAGTDRAGSPGSPTAS